MKIFDNLTKRQKEILELICLGFSNEQIANRLYISKPTLYSHIEALYEAYHVKDTKNAHRVTLVLKRLEELSK